MPSSERLFLWSLGLWLAVHGHGKQSAHRRQASPSAWRASSQWPKELPQAAQVPPPKSTRWGARLCHLSLCEDLQIQVRQGGEGQKGLIIVPGALRALDFVGSCYCSSPSKKFFACSWICMSIEERVISHFCMQGMFIKELITTMPICSNSSCPCHSRQRILGILRRPLLLSPES